MMTNRTATRRDVLRAAAALSAAVAIGGRRAAVGAPEESAGKEKPPQTAIPRWRGFNLLPFFQAFSRGDLTIDEDDLRWMKDWGFDFVRLPMDYWLWIDSDWRATRKMNPDHATRIKEATLEKVDGAVELCRKHGLHVNLNLHRAPGYCINDPEREPFVLWSDARAEDAFIFHWDLFAKRYKGVPAAALSFNLVNEAPGPRQGYMTRDDYRRVMARAIGKIRETSPDRIIFADGLSVGTVVADELIPLGVPQSVHAYHPAQISHYRAQWVDRDSSFPTPTWPLRKKDGSIQLDRAGLERHFAPWAELARKGIGVHCGECGCYNRTPYDVFFAWFSDVMEILKGHGIGYALWNFRGSFGIIDSGRADAAYEDWHGHKLDRKLLDLLRSC